jgi:hypothetical protein
MNASKPEPTLCYGCNETATPWLLAAHGVWCPKCVARRVNAFDELLAACKAAEPWLSTDCSIEGKALQTVQAAIAKAEGETNATNKAL